MDPGLGSEVMEKARGRGVGWWLGQARGEMAVRDLPPARPFDGAQGERPLAGDGSRLGGRDDGGVGVMGRGWEWIGSASGVEAISGVP